MGEFVGVVTEKGLQKSAASWGGAPLTPALIRVGDGNGAPITPTKYMTDLVRRVGDGYPIVASARDATNPAMWRFRAVIPAAAGPFDVREIGLFDAAGDMLAVARHVLVEKRTAAQGAAVEIETDILVPFADTAQIVVQIAPEGLVGGDRLLRAGWLTVDGVVANPPAQPAPGATYVVTTNPTGAWAGLVNKLAQWNGSMWVSFDPPPGHVVSDRSKGEADPARYLKRAANGTWASAAASDAAFGLTRIATFAEARAGLSREVVVCAADLVSLTYTRPPGPVYYVDNVNGSDATKDGSTPQTAFRTLQGAVDAITARYLSASEVSLVVAASLAPYEPVAFVRSFVPAWRLQLAAGAVIDAMSLAVNAGRGVVVGKGAQASVSGGAIRARYEALVTSGGLAELRDCALTLSTHPSAFTVAGYEGGSIRLFGNISVSGQGRGLLAAVSGATALIGYADDASQIAAHIAYAAGVQFSGAGVVAAGGTVAVAPSQTTFAGAPQGQKYAASLAGGINVSGAGVNFLPGTVAGVTDTATGGWYV